MSTLYATGGPDDGDQGEPMAGDPVMMTWRDGDGQEQPYTFAMPQTVWHAAVTHILSKNYP